MARMTNAVLKSENDNLRAELEALRADRNALKEDVDGDVLPTKDVNGVTVIKRGHGLDPMALFHQAMEQKILVTYGAIGEAMGVVEVGGPFLNTEHLPPIKEMITESEADHLVVNLQGRYGRNAPVESHLAKLKALGYTKLPKAAKPKVKAAATMDGKAEIVATILAKLLS